MRAGRFMFLRDCSGDDIVEFTEDVEKERILNPRGSSLIAMAKDKLFDQGT